MTLCANFGAVNGAECVDLSRAKERIANGCDGGLQGRNLYARGSTHLAEKRRDAGSDAPRRMHEISVWLLFLIISHFMCQMVVA